MTPIPAHADQDRRVIGEGVVGTRWARSFRVFRYEIHGWRSGAIPDLASAIESPCVYRPTRRSPDDCSSSLSPSPRRYGNATNSTPARYGTPTRSVPGSCPAAASTSKMFARLATVALRLGRGCRGSWTRRTRGGGVVPHGEGGRMKAVMLGSSSPTSWCIVHLFGASRVLDGWTRCS